VHKIASASLTDDNLLRTFVEPEAIILSTGMSTYAEIDHAVGVLGKEDLVLMHATSTYPADYEELNLRAIPAMIERYGVPVGYSGHERHPQQCLRRCYWRLLCGKTHYDEPRHVGLGSGCIVGAKRHFAVGS